MQQPAAEEKTKPRRRRADMYQQQGNAANVTNAETAKPAVEDVSGTTQKMPPIRSTFQRNAEAGETKQVKPVAPVAPGFQPRLDFLNALGRLHGVHGVF